MEHLIWRRYSHTLVIFDNAPLFNIHCPIKTKYLLQRILAHFSFRAPLLFGWTSLVKATSTPETLQWSTILKTYRQLNWTEHNFSENTVFWRISIEPMPRPTPLRWKLPDTPRNCPLNEIEWTSNLHRHAQIRVDPGHSIAMCWPCPLGTKGPW